MKREEDVENKLEMVREYMKRRRKKGAFIKKTYNFSWITSGGRSYILPSDSKGIAAVFVTKSDAYIIANNNEVERLRKEELPSNFFLVSSPWFTSLEETFSNISDEQSVLYEEDREFDSFLFHSRIVLTDYEKERYTVLGKRTASALEKAMRLVKPTMTEIEVQALITQELIFEGLEPLLVLVFGDESRKLYKHNLPRNVEVFDVCIASVCARFKGLIASATRSVEFSESTQFERTYNVNAKIDAEIVRSSYERDLLSQVFLDIERIYEEHAYPYEWQQHHQGGIAGYRTREVLARPHFPFPIRENMVFAWNPTLPGTKVEDTYLRTENGMKLLTKSDTHWPYLTFEVNGTKYERPAPLKM